MKENNSRRPEGSATSFKIIENGPRPPCLEPGFGICRGCFGWQNMIEAAASGDKNWCRAEIHCRETGLTVRFS